MATDQEKLREERIAKLPQWAQRDIERLERNATYWREKANAGPADSNTYVYSFEDSKPLGDSPRIRFWLARPGEGGEYIDAHLVEEYGRMVLEIGGDQHLVILPRSGNRAVVEVAPR